MIDPYTSATMEHSQPLNQKAKDGTLYWTLSFYFPIDRINSSEEGCDRVRRGDPSHNTEVLENADVTKATRLMRNAIEPLFNDIADRSRLGEVNDYLFAGKKNTQTVNREYVIKLQMPKIVAWTTEGKEYRVEIPENHRQREVGLSTFWYLYGNGSMSWHLSFSVYYKEDLQRDLREGVPSTYYFLSLLQKLAWPKEFVCPQAEGKPVSEETTIDQLVAMIVKPPKGPQQTFWKYVESLYEGDRDLIETIHGGNGKPYDFTILSPRQRSLEVPGLSYHDNRSLFFVHDSELFALIQPKNKNGELESRRKHVSNREFAKYPALVANLASKKSSKETGVVFLDKAYWGEVLGRSEPAVSSEDFDEQDDLFLMQRSAYSSECKRRLAYLFLAGFNQNIIDFTNQEASEVLDSLDPIYPNSDEQMEEGFFIRYANPRAMITYVPRSRSLEVGNDYIRTCPYAFLIHVLSMHNEVLTRGQELTTFKAIRDVGSFVERAEAARRSGEPLDLEEFGKKECKINRVRLDAFEIYDRHRYVNPFRYDTERDVFDELERLRGTSRLKSIHDVALSSLEEHMQDLDRIRREYEAKQAKNAEQRITVLFIVLGVVGAIQTIFAADQFLRGAIGSIKFFLLFSYIVGPVLVCYWASKIIKKRQQ